MRNRITWENVAAPDFGNAIRGVNAAGDSIAGAFNTAGTAIKDIGTNNNKQASAAAMAKAMGITDPAEWDAFMKAGGPAAAGVSPDRLTEDAMAFFRDRGQSLLDQDKTAANIDLLGAQTNETVANTGLIGVTTGLRNAQIGETVANTGRIGAETARTQNQIGIDNASMGIDLARENDRNRDDDFAYNRAVEGYEAGQATLARETEARDVVDALTNRTDITDQNQLKSAISQAGLDPLTEKAALAEAGNIDPVLISATEEEVAAVRNDPFIVNQMDALSGINTAIDFQYGGDKMLSYYEQGVSGGEGKGSLDNLIGRLVQGKDKAESSQWSGTIVNMHNDLVKETGLPPEVVTAVMAESLQGGMVPGWDLGDLKVSESKAKEVLRSLGDPVERVALENRRLEKETARREVTAVQGKLEKASLKLAKAKREGNLKDAEKYAEEVQDAYGQVLKLSEKWQPGVDTNTQSPGASGSKTPTINTTDEPYSRPADR